MGRDIKSIKITFPIDPRAQLVTILHDPFQYIIKLVNTFLDFDYLYVQFFGVFGWGETAAPYSAGIIFLILLVASVVLEMKNSNHDFVTAKKGLIPFVVSILTVITIESALYLTWPQEKGNVIFGLQGRYFIPVTLLFLYAIFLLKPIIKKMRQQYIYTAFMLVILALSLKKVLHRFW